MIDNCDAVESLLVREAERTASAAELVQLNAHLKDCASCREALADQRAMRELLQNHPVEGARLGFDTRVMAAIRAEAEEQSRSWLDNLDFRRWTWRLVPVAAVLALMSVVVNQSDTTIAQAGDDTTVIASAGTDDLPVSSALWSESVSGSSLLSLMLTANADDTLSTYRKDQ